MPFTLRQCSLCSETHELAISYNLLYASYVLDSVLTQVTLGTLKAVFVFEHKRPKEKVERVSGYKFYKALILHQLPTIFKSTFYSSR